MDLGNFWQQNKRFVVSVVSGVIVFVILLMVIDGLYGSDLVKLTREVNQNENRLRNTPLYTRVERDLAQAQNEALQQSIAGLESRVRFTPRPAFRLDPAGAPAANQYFAIVAQTREELLRSAGRANLRVPEDLGLPALSPTRDADIAKHLEALDLVERVVRLALESGAQRVERIEIRLDPKLNSREGVGELERTRVAFTLSGDPAPLTALLIASQETREVKLGEATLRVLPLPIEKAEINPARSKSDEASLEVVFLLVTLHERSEENGGS